MGWILKYLPVRYVEAAEAESAIRKLLRRGISPWKICALRKSGLISVSACEASCPSVAPVYPETSMRNDMSEKSVLAVLNFIGNAAIPRPIQVNIR